MVGSDDDGPLLHVVPPPQDAVLTRPRSVLLIQLGPFELGQFDLGESAFVRLRRLGPNMLVMSLCPSWAILEPEGRVRARDG